MNIKEFKIDKKITISGTISARLYAVDNTVADPLADKYIEISELLTFNDARYVPVSLALNTTVQQNGLNLILQSTWGAGNRYTTEIAARNTGYIELSSYDNYGDGKFSWQKLNPGNYQVRAGSSANGNYGQFRINDYNSYWAYYDDATELDGVMYMGSRGASYAADYSTEFDTNDRAIPDVGWINSKITLKQNVFPGFDPLTPITISIDYVTRVLTITPTLAYFNFFTDGAGVSVKHTKTGVQNFPAFTDNSGIWYFYYDSSGNAVTTQTQWTDFDTITTVYRLLWNASETGARKAVVESCEHHENSIPAIDHLWKHAYRTINISGFDCINNKLASGSPNASGLNTVIGFTTGRNMDDNLLYTITNSTSGDRWQQDLGEITPANLTISNGALIDIRYDSGGLQYRLDATRFPFAWDSGTNRPQYITSAGVRTLVSNQYHFVYFVYSIQDPRNGKGIMLVSAPGQYNTITDAKAINWADIQAAYPTINDHEVRPLARIIFQYNQTYDAAIKYSVIRDVQDIRSVPITSTTASGTVLGSSVTTSATTNITSTNVQSDKENIDALIASKQATLVSGTNIKTLNGQSVLGAGNLDLAAVFEPVVIPYNKDVNLSNMTAWAIASLSAADALNPVTIGSKHGNSTTYVIKANGYTPTFPGFIELPTDNEWDLTTGYLNIVIFTKIGYNYYYQILPSYLGDLIEPDVYIDNFITSGRLRINIDSNATFYYGVFANGYSWGGKTESEKTSAIKVGTDCIDYGSVLCTSGVEAYEIFTGVVADANYDVYYFAEFDEMPTSPVTLYDFSTYLETETTTLLSTYGTQPSTNGKIQINKLIKDLKHYSLWSKIDIMYLFHMHTNAGGEAYKNIKNPSSYNATMIGTLGFTAYHGFIGATGAGLNLNYNPSTNGVNFTKDNAGIFMHIPSGATHNMVGCVSTTRCHCGLAEIGINSLNLPTVTNPEPRNGFYVMQRTSSTNMVIYKNLVSLGSFTESSLNVPNLNMYALARNNNGTIDQTSANNRCSILGISTSLSEQERSIVKSITDYYIANFTS